MIRLGMDADGESSMEDLLDAAREVERRYYERDALWVKLSAGERQEADAAADLPDGGPGCTKCADLCSLMR